MARLVASWFGSGLILGRFRDSDRGSGTVGAFLALVISLLLGNGLGWPAQVTALVLTLIAGWWAAAQFVEEGDPGWIVVDEAAGTFLATIGLAWGPALVAFAVFRLADVTKKPFPGVSQAERLGGATGIMADDLVAGLYGLVAGHLIRMAFF